ncbi:MAG: peptide ABC transporter substrate-binding protein, partial [Eubacteriales bacterium]
MKKRIISMLTAVAMVATLLVGCSVPGETTTTAESTTEESSTDDAAAETGDTYKSITYSVTAEPPSLDPQLANSVSCAAVQLHIGEGLMRSNDGEITCAGAESYEISEDGLTYTFYLREDATWSDGVGIVAADYVYGLQRLMDPATACDYAFIGMIVKNGTAINSGEMAVEELGITAIDDYTLQIELEYAATYFLSMLTMSQYLPTRQDIVEEYGQDFAADPEKNVYSGPFVISDWTHGDEITLTRNEYYWDSASINLDEINCKVVSDSNTAVAMFEAGDLDVCLVPTDMSEMYADESIFYFDGANDYLAMNTSEDRVTSNVNLRFAINYAIQRDEYITLTSNDIYEANTRYVLPQVNGAEEGSTYGEEYPYEAFPVEGDMDTALEYLATAMEEMGVTDPADIEVEFLTTDTDKSRIQAEVIQAQLQTNLGITVTIKQVTYAQRLELESDRDFDMVFTGWVPDYPDPYSYL